MVWKFLEISTFKDSFLKLKTLFSGARKALGRTGHALTLSAPSHLSRDECQLLPMLIALGRVTVAWLGWREGWRGGWGAGISVTVRRQGIENTHVTMRKQSFCGFFFSKFEETLSWWRGSGNTAMHCVLCLFFSQVIVKGESHNS